MNSAAVRQLEPPPSDSRQRILDAATRLMSERGYAGTSISMVTRLSGLPASSTYWHFGSKEGLLCEVLEYAASSFLQSLPRFEDVDGTPRERLHEIVRQAFVRNRKGDPDFFRLYMVALEAGEDHGEVRDTIRRVRAQVARAWKPAFTEVYGEQRDAEVEAMVGRLAVFALAAGNGSLFAPQADSAHDGRAIGAMTATAFLVLADEFFAAGRN
jgi:AcrR family transcriptional regulator